MRSIRLLTIFLAPVLLATACAGPEEAPASAPLVESPAAGVRIAALPEVFVVSENDADGLRLDAPGLPGPSSVAVTLGPEVEGGLNIIDAVGAALDELAARPGGESFGQTQLVAPIGLAFMARGRWDAGGTRMEQLTALVAHPWGNRLLSLAYTYPVGEDTQERGAQLMELLGEVESLEAPETPEVPAE